MGCGTTKNHIYWMKKSQGKPRTPNGNEGGKVFTILSLLIPDCLTRDYSFCYFPCCIASCTVAVRLVLDSLPTVHCTVPFLNCTILVLYHACTVPFLYCTILVLYHSCTVPCLYCTMLVLYHSCTVPFLYCTILVLYHSCSLPLKI